MEFSYKYLQLYLQLMDDIFKSVRSYQSAKTETASKKQDVNIAEEKEKKAKQEWEEAHS